MAEIAIPILLMGAAYLVSNDNSEEEEKENFADLNEASTQGNLLANQYEDYNPNVSKTELNTNNEQNLSSYYDKYFLQKQDNMTNNDAENEFETLAGNKIKIADVKHNNMAVYYNNKSNGTGIRQYDNILDNYTGQGTFDIKKEEISSFFKPSDNAQNVFGNQNVNNFLQSRVNPSMRRANEAPMESIKVTPGMNMDYGEVSQMGFNNSMMSRESWQPKTVDELRAENNPKMVYRLDDHMGPALQSVQNRGIQGKIVKKTPETFFQNDNNLGMVAGLTGAKESARRPNQELNEQNRDTTTSSYYGVKGPGGEHVSYANGEYQEAHKQQLPSKPFSNFSGININPTNELNYSKESYNSLPNNRSTTRSNYFGSMGSLVSSVVQPVINGLRHSKKTNVVKNSNMGNLTGNKNPLMNNPYQHAPTTNREMYDCKLGMNHLNVQSQDSTAYMNARPLVEATNRSTMNQGETGPAMAGPNGLGNKSYSNVYNQRNNNKLFASDVQSGGSMDLFNSNISMKYTNKEVCNDRSTPFYNPQDTKYNHPTELIGQFSSMPQHYENKTNDYLDSSMLNAFKNNPYTQPLNSVA